MRSLLQSDIVVWVGVGYVIFVYGVLLFCGSKVATADSFEQSTTGHPAERRGPYD